MLNLLTVNTVAELTCFLIALICLLKDSSIVWRCMALYLLSTCAAEILGLYVTGPKHLISNHWVYNCFLTCEIGFTHLMFYYLLSRYINSKPLILTGLALLFLLYIIETFRHSFFVYNNLTFTVMSVLFVVYSLCYYYLLLKDERYVMLKYSAEFWWVAGTLFFYFSNTACNFFGNNLRSVIMPDGHTLNFYIFRALNILLYGCWSYSFICRRWIKVKSEF
jgi:hypothetical protein